MTTPITTTTSNSQMHNDIIAAGSRERPPMLAQEDMLSGSHKSPFQLNQQQQQKTKYLNILLLKHTTAPEKRTYFDVEAEAIHMILSRIRDDIYSIVDACTTAKEMLIAIERLNQGESLTKQDVKTNIFWEFGKFTLRDRESIESYYSRFYKMMNEMVRNQLEVATMQVNVQFLQQLQPEWSRYVTIVKKQENLDIISYHKLFDILKQYQHEANEIHAEKIVRNANPLALVVAAQHYPEYHNQPPKPHKPNVPSSRQITSSKSHATTRSKGKEVVKLATPSSKSASDEHSDKLIGSDG
ncbi:hypothetical protein Tco_0449495 [Tanacetum coccineum]